MLNKKYTSKDTLFALLFLSLGLSLIIGISSGNIAPGYNDIEIVKKAQNKALSNDIATAESYLENTPMQGLGKTIVETANEYKVDWRIIIGLAKIESSFGSHFYNSYDVNCHNYWGIKPPGGRRADGSYLRCYYTDKDGVNSISALLARRYKNQTPEEMNCTYVVPCNQNWVNIINQYLI